MLASRAFLYLFLFGASSQLGMTQAPSEKMPGPICAELNRQNQGQGPADSTKVSTTLSDYLRSGANPAETSCAAIIFGDEAEAMVVAGRIAQAEVISLRLLDLLENSYPSADPIFIKPLYNLAFARFQLGKRAQAWQAYRRMQLIHPAQPPDRARIHGMAATLLYSRGKFKDAEEAWREALADVTEWGRSNSPDAAAILIALARVYIDDRRTEQARKMLGRARQILDTVGDSASFNEIGFLHARGLLHARRREWSDAEHDMREAVSMADREEALAPAVSGVLLDFAVILRKVRRPIEARSIEMRAAAFRNRLNAEAVIDVGELSADSKPRRK